MGHLPFSFPNFWLRHFHMWLICLIRGKQRGSGIHRYSNSVSSLSYRFISKCNEITLQLLQKWSFDKIHFNSLILIVRISNLGWSFLPWKVPSDTLYLSSWWTNWSEIWYTSNLIRVTKGITNFAELIHQELRYGVSDRSSEAKKEQPKLHIRTLNM